MESLYLSLAPEIKYLVILATFLASSVGVPIPEEATVIAAGILSAHGMLSPLLAAAVCWLGAIAGDCLVYFLGHHFGKNVVREHRLWAHFVTPEREERMERSIRRHGIKILFSARFLVGVRSAVYLAAGILRVPFRRFLITDLISATLVVGAFFWISFRYGKTITTWIRQGEAALTTILLLSAIGLLVFLWRRHRREKRCRRYADKDSKGRAPRKSHHQANQNGNPDSDDADRYRAKHDGC